MGFLKALGPMERALMAERSGQAHDATPTGQSSARV